jgi:hypothetical protein
MVKKVNPGSKEARKSGCTCPVIDNAYGKGVFCDGEKNGWWINGNCPIHGQKEEGQSKVRCKHCNHKMFRTKGVIDSVFICKNCGYKNEKLIERKRI